MWAALYQLTTIKPALLISAGSYSTGCNPIFSTLFCEARMMQSIGSPTPSPPG